MADLGRFEVEWIGGNGSRAGPCRKSVESRAKSTERAPESTFRFWFRRSLNAGGTALGFLCLSRERRAAKVPDPCLSPILFLQCHRQWPPPFKNQSASEESLPDPNGAYSRRLLDDSGTRTPIGFRSAGAGARGIFPRATLVPRLPWAIHLSGLRPF